MDTFGSLLFSEALSLQQLGISWDLFECYAICCLFDAAGRELLSLAGGLLECRGKSAWVAECACGGRAQQCTLS